MGRPLGGASAARRRQGLMQALLPVELVHQAETSAMALIESLHQRGVCHEDLKAMLDGILADRDLAELVVMKLARQVLTEWTTTARASGMAPAELLLKHKARVAVRGTLLDSPALAEEP
jgi:hypothetical protein